jgi:hypothetical protein
MSDSTATKSRRSPTRKPPAAKPAVPATPQTRVRHGRFHDAVWERAETRAEGRGVWEVLRQKLAEYADERDHTP